MAESFVPAIVPPSTDHEGRSRWSSSRPVAAGVKRIPVSGLAPLWASVGTVYRIACVDHRGRVAERSVVRALGWHGELRLQVRVISGAVVVRADPAGVFTLARRGHIPIPPRVRLWCGLAAGDRVLLAADAERGVLVVHTLAALDGLLASRHAALLGGEVS